MMRTSFAVLLVLSTAPAVAQERRLPFDQGWTLDGEKTAVVTADGRQALAVETGFAHRRDVSLMDGTIDFDVQLTSRRSFVYVYFRAVAGGDREEFYLRPHKSSLPDAVQYAPVWQGRSSWQLYHGPGATAAAGFVPGEWTHVRVVMQGRQAAIFVQDMTTPALFVPRLAREPQPGSISLGGFLPAGVPGDGPIARFSNVVVQPGVSFDLAKAAAAASAPAPAVPGATVIAAWSVSAAFVPKDQAPRALPGGDATGAFTTLKADPGGLLELHRYVKIPQGARPWAAVARVNVRAERAGTYALELGFSDIATVFVNGTPTFRGDATYSFDRPRREGLIGFDQATVYLPLKAGDNDLAVLVSDVFGGWGLMGRFVSAPGLTVTAR